jgi:hypothetical protein
MADGFVDYDDLCVCESCGYCEFLERHSLWLGDLVEVFRMEAYCMKCKCSVLLLDAVQESVNTKKGVKFLVRAKCKICVGSVCKFVKGDAV